MFEKVPKYCIRRRILTNARLGVNTDYVAISGTGFRKWGEEHDNEKNNQWYDRDRFSGS